MDHDFQSLQHLGKPERKPAHGFPELDEIVDSSKVDLREYLQKAAAFDHSLQDSPPNRRGRKQEQRSRATGDTRASARLVSPAVARGEYPSRAALFLFTFFYLH